jgi:hypothetical protein
MLFLFMIYYYQPDKLDPQGKKRKFIRYSEHSKGYVFIDEQSSENIIEFESQDVIFLENEFSRKIEIGQDFSLYEEQEQNDLIITNHLVHISEPPIVSCLSENKSVDDVELNSSQSQVIHINCIRIFFKVIF